MTDLLVSTLSFLHVLCDMKRR